MTDKHSERALAVVLGVALAITVLKGWRVPNDYAAGHWLFSYEHGLIKRGLLGTLAWPVMRSVGPRVAFVVIAGLGAALLAAFFAAAIVAVRRLGGRGHLALVPILLCASPAAVLLVHCIGYFDAAVLLLGILAVDAVARGRLAAAAIASVVGIFIHEIYAAVALPAVALALLSRGGASRREELGRWAVTLAPPLVAFAILHRFGGLAPEARVALKEDVLHLEVVRFEDVSWLFTPLDLSLAQSYARMSHVWTADWLVAALWEYGHHLPFIAFVSASLWVAARRLPRRVVVLGGAGFVVLAPLALHLVAWDINRISALSAFSAFLAWLAVWSAPGLQKAELGPRWLAAAVVAGALSLSADPWLFDGYAVAHYPEMLRRLPHEARKLWRPLRYRDLDFGPVLFENSDFEAGTTRGWERLGEAFPEAPLEGEPWISLGRPAIPEGRFFMGSGPGQRRTRTGRLVSEPFVVSGDVIAFKLGAGASPESTYVTFSVEGREVARFWAADTSERMDLVRFDVRAHRGASMTIDVVDVSATAHLNVDGFRYE